MAVKTHVDLLQNRRTKIIATVGPTSSNENVLEDLILAGVNVFRLNLSHGDQAGHQQVFDTIHRVSDRLETPVAILADLCGPKIRTGRFPGGSMTLTDGDTVTVSTTAKEGGEGVIATTYTDLARDVATGNRILLADGLFELEVKNKTETEAICRVVHGGVLSDNKGINLPGVDVSAPSMTEKDHDDAAFVLDLGVDFIALSFVRTAADIGMLRAVIDERGSHARIVAKIEKPEALDNADEILAATDAIMVARGDLGVELPPEQVPTAQRQLIHLARDSGVPVIVATQMLESMIQHSRPTRAEVTDVFHAVESRADAVMLSAETAAGDFPVEAVQMMDRIARQTEAELWSSGAYGSTTRQPDPPIPLWNVIATATARMSRDLMARAVMVVTRGGRSAEIVATARPASPIVAMTKNPVVYRKLCLKWGVIPILEKDVGTVNPNELARRQAVQLGLAERGQYVLLVRGFHGEQDKNLPSVTVVEV
ncbi:MAG: pyruvate kinase [Gammaproteobacteria bacterium]|jgi:pyruvate kinase|nr:pyruvate kinase [Gammaproteobacteria bacterium]